jgi:hypothetical protein
MSDEYRKHVKEAAETQPIPRQTLSDRYAYRIETEDTRKGTHEILAHGSDALGPHERIMIHRQRMAMIGVTAAYTAAVAFAAVAAALIIFASESRALAANIVAATLLILAAGIAGYTRVSAKLPGSEILADKSQRTN